VIIAGALLEAAHHLLGKGIHPTIISEAFQKANKQAQDILQNMSVPLDLSDRESLLKSATTSLSSKVGFSVFPSTVTNLNPRLAVKVVSQYSNLLSPIAVDAIQRIVDPKTATNVDLRDVRVVKKLGGTIEDTELVDGIVFAQKASHVAGGPTRITNAKIGLIQFCLSAPKTNVSLQIWKF